MKKIFLLALILTINIKANAQLTMIDSLIQDVEIDAYEFVIKESQSGGKLDFKSVLNKNQLYIYDKIAYSYEKMAIILWTTAIRKLNFPKKKALDMIQEIRNDDIEPWELKLIKKVYKT